MWVGRVGGRKTSSRVRQVQPDSGEASGAGNGPPRQCATTADARRPTCTLQLAVPAGQTSVQAACLHRGTQARGIAVGGLPHAVACMPVAWFLRLCARRMSMQRTLLLLLLLVHGCNNGRRRLSPVLSPSAAALRRRTKTLCQAALSSAAQLLTEPAHTAPAHTPPAHTHSPIDRDLLLLAICAQLCGAVRRLPMASA